MLQNEYVTSLGVIVYGEGAVLPGYTCIMIHDQYGNVYYINLSAAKGQKFTWNTCRSIVDRHNSNIKKKKQITAKNIRQYNIQSIDHPANIFTHRW